MKKQLILIFSGIALVFILFFFGRTSSTKKDTPSNPVQSSTVKNFDPIQFIASEKAKLPLERAAYVAKLENNISRGDILSQQIKSNEALASFWKDSVKSFELYAFYTSNASKLVNSEKNLTFAARIFLDNLRGEKDISKLNWETTEAIDLFERAIKLNPDNDDLKIGLGSCYIYGKGRSGNPQETMQGVLKILDVVRKDSTNMKAQMMLGIGGLVSGQFEKAIPRLEKVVAAQPNNVEAITYLADGYAAIGKKEDAIRYYNLSKKIVDDPAFSSEVDEHIRELK